MNKEFQSYVDRIIGIIGLSGKKERQIREDLNAMLIEKSEATGEKDPYILMGDPEEVAEEFIENLHLKNNKGYNNRYYGMYGFGYEYVSKTMVFGVPLVHVNFKPLGIAKGIFSFGSVAIGVFSFGAISIGAVSFGGIALGLIAALAGIAVSGMLSFGGLAIAYGISIGGLAVSKFIAFGGFARADIAIGGVTKGIVSIFNQHGSGLYQFKAPADKEQVAIAIRKVYPSISKGFLDFINFFL